MSSTNPVEAKTEVQAPRRTLSLSARLTLWYSLSAFVVVLGVTGYLYRALARNLNAEDEQLLADQVLILRGLFRDRPEDAAALRQEVEFEFREREHERIYLRILDVAGNLVMETPGMADDLGPSLFPPPAGVQDHPRFGATVRTSPGRVFRLMAAEAALGSAGLERRIVQAALDVTGVEKLLARLRQRMFPALAISLLACAWIGYRI